MKIQKIKLSEVIKDKSITKSVKYFIVGNIKYLNTDYEGSSIFIEFKINKK